jgi:hypothetical protein
MPRYPYRDIGTGLGRDFRNNLNANFDDIEADVKELDTRIDNIVANAGSSNTEIVDARYDAINNVTYPTLKDRLDDTSDKIGILSNAKIYVEKFPRQGTETDDTARIQRAIDTAPEYSTIIFEPNKTYYISNITITKSLNIDLNGAKLVVDPTTNGTNGSPVFWFKGTVGNSYNLTTCTERSTTVTLSNPSDASNFAVGDYVIIEDVKSIPAWDNTPGGGYTGRSEVNIIKSIAGATITLSKPIEWGYDTSPKITKITKMLTQPKIYGAAYITEVDPGGVYSGNLTGACPHIFHFQYCIEPEVKDCTFDKWQLHAVNFHYCINPKTSGCSATDPYRPEQGGHGYFVRYDHCSSASTSRNYGRKVRHMIDYVQSYDCHSNNNYSIDCAVIDYYMHGLGSKRCSSSHDTSVGSASYGWAMGNPSFNADYDFTIINPKYLGNNYAIVAQTNSEGLKVISPEINTGIKGVVGLTGASKISVIGGTIEVVSESVNASAIYTKQDASTGLKVKDVSVENVDIKVVTSANVNAISIDAEGVVSVKAKINHSGTGVGVYIDSTTTPEDLEISNCTIIGTMARGIHVAVAPTRKYLINNNFIAGYTTSGVYLAVAGNLRYIDNHIVGASNHFAVIGDLAAAKTAGAILFRNVPNTFDEMPLVKGTKVSAKSIDIDDLAGTNRQINFYSNGSLRWIIRADSSSESGSNNGTNLMILARDDTGGSLYTVATFERSTGKVTMNANAVTIAGTYQKPLYFGTYALWVDSSGKLRIKNGVPTSDTDGTIVGTQT